MFLRFGRAYKKGGAKYTIISILIIFVMMVILRITAPNKTSDYPEIVFYNSYEYHYSETLKDNPLTYTKRKNMSYEGYSLLVKRTFRTENPPKNVYIYTSMGKYRKYIFEKQ